MVVTYWKQVICYFIYINTDRVESIFPCISLKTDQNERAFKINIVAVREFNLCINSCIKTCFWGKQKCLICDCTRGVILERYIHWNQTCLTAIGIKPLFQTSTKSIQEIQTYACGCKFSAKKCHSISSHQRSSSETEHFALTYVTNITCVPIFCNFVCYK